MTLLVEKNNHTQCKSIVCTVQYVLSAHYVYLVPDSVNFLRKVYVAYLPVTRWSINYRDFRKKECFTENVTIYMYIERIKIF